MRGKHLHLKSTWLLVLLLATIAALLIFPTPSFPETLPFKIYTASEGLAHDRANRIVRDSRGFLWFCTSEGLSRFDGYQFKNYTQDDGLPHRGLMDFLETRDGEYLIATGDGLVRFDPRGRSNREAGGDENSPPMFRVFRPEVTGPRVLSWVVNKLLEDRSGVVWVAAVDGLYRLRKDDDWRLERFDVPESVKNKNEEFSELLEDSSRAIWAATTMGLYRILADRSTIQTIDPKIRAGSFLEDGQRQVWVGRVGGEPEQAGLEVYSIADTFPNYVRTFMEKDGLVSHFWINDLLRTLDGRIFVGVGNSLSEYVPDAPAGEPEFKTLDRDGVVALAEDASGNVWFSTNSGGVRRMARGGFVNFGESDNLTVNHINSIVVPGDGYVYIVAELTKILRFDGKSFSSFSPREMIAQSWGRGRVSFRDSTGSWWIASGAGLQRYPPVEKIEDLERVRPLKTYTTKDGLFSDMIFQLFEDSRGDVWISGIGSQVDSLSRWERSTEKIHRYTHAEHGFPSLNPVTAFGEDRAGNIWIGYYGGGVARYREGKLDLFGPEDNLPTGYIGNIFCDSSGRMWISTSYGGVVRVDDPTTDEKPRLVPVTTHHGLSSNQANCTTEDNFGRIYVSTGRGVNRLDLQTGRVKVFTKADGLPENIVTQCNRDHEGALWFGSWSGLARYVPTAEAQDSPPPVFLSDLRVNGESIKRLSQLGETSLENLSFAADQRQIQIEFFALGFGVGETLRYQYKMEGTESAWSEPTTQRTVNLGLSPGSYTFLVRAISAEGTASETPALVSFSIARPIWQRSWFLLIVALTVAAGAYLFYRYRLAQLLKLERVRTRIATDLHDDIGSSLSQIAILSEVARHNAGENGAAEPLRRIADTSRDLVDSMSDIVWAINPQKDHLSDLVQRMRRFAGDTFDATDVRYNFRLDDSIGDIGLGADLRREIYLIFKECVNNTAKHARASEVAMEVTAEAGRLVVAIEDDGVGFDVAQAFSGEIKGYGGNGLLNIRRRAERLGGDMRIESKAGEGTSVRVTIPTSSKLRMVSTARGIDN